MCFTGILSLKCKGKYKFLLKILIMLLQVRCHKQKRDEHRAGTHKSRANGRVHVCAVAMAAAATEWWWWHQQWQEGAHTSSNIAAAQEAATEL
jgi:hypothetical protein